MPDPERYVDVDRLKKELPFLPADFRMEESEGEEDCEWTEFLKNLLNDESERVESWFGEDNISESETNAVVVDGIIRLVRNRLDRINTDGVESENLVDGSSYTYEPSRSVIKTVKYSIGEVLKDSKKGAWTV